MKQTERRSWWGLPMSLAAASPSRYVAYMMDSVLVYSGLIAFAPILDSPQFNV
jgi:hypothetical protein